MTFVKFSVISVISGVSGNSRESTWPVKGVQLANSCVKKIKLYCKKDIKTKLKFLYDTTKLEFFCNNKDKTPFFNNSYVVYHFNYPGWCASYVGKTQRTLRERCIEYAWSDKDSAVRAYIKVLEYLCTCNIFCLINGPRVTFGIFDWHMLKRVF